jgi:hypothetical protein
MNGLRIIDISDPANPSETGHLFTNGQVLDLDVDGNLVYIADGFDGMRVIDVSDPSNPFETGSFDSPGSANAIAVKGSFAYLADGSDGLRIIDITNPSDPQEAGYLDTEGWAIGVSVSGDYAFVADDYNGLRIIHIAEPSLPYEISFVSMQMAEDVYADSNYAYVSGGIEGLKIINVSDPFTPVEAGNYITGGLAISSAVNNGYAYMADGEDGMYIIRNDLIIPVELVSLTAAVVSGDVELNWATATELNNKGFEIQRINLKSNSGWAAIGFIQGNGTTNNPRSYSFIDNNVSNGVYCYRLKQIDFNGTFKYSNEIEVNVNTPAQFSLSQNYPNPFNPETLIKYAMDTREQVTLKVYDILGREVATLINEIKQPGYYETKFNGSNYPSGVYFYKLSSPDHCLLKKMILLK